MEALSLVLGIKPTGHDLDGFATGGSESQQEDAEPSCAGEGSGEHTGYARLSSCECGEHLANILLEPWDLCKGSGRHTQEPAS